MEYILFEFLQMKKIVTTNNLTRKKQEPQLNILSSKKKSPESKKFSNLSLRLSMQTAVEILNQLHIHFTFRCSLWRSVVYVPKNSPRKYCTNITPMNCSWTTTCGAFNYSLFLIDQHYHMHLHLSN